MSSEGIRISASHIDSEINSLVSGAQSTPSTYTRHFNQNEEFFIKSSTEFEVSSLPIHHDVNIPKPERVYQDGLLRILDQLLEIVPEVFLGLTYFFDPAEIMKPRFYRIYTIDDTQYLYLFQIDLICRTQEAEVLQKGTNDTTPMYRTQNLYIDALYIPLEEVTFSGSDQGNFTVKQTLSETWIGETGRGYFAKGIWIDDDLTKFFTRLLIPAGKRIYPYYPFVCRYKTICHALINFEPSSREAALPHFHRAVGYLLPAFDRIQQELRDKSFSEELSIFQKLKSEVPSEWYDPFDNLAVERYLNSSEMREFRIDD